MQARVARIKQIPRTAEHLPDVKAGSRIHLTRATDVSVFRVSSESQLPLEGQLARLPASTSTPDGVYAADYVAQNMGARARKGIRRKRWRVQGDYYLSPSQGGL